MPIIDEVPILTGMDKWHLKCSTTFIWLCSTFRSTFDPLVYVIVVHK